MKKSSSMRIRLDPVLHQEFLEVCKADDIPAAQVLREFMRNYVGEQLRLKQAEMFDIYSPTNKSASG